MADQFGKSTKTTTFPVQVIALIIIALLCGSAGLGIRWLSASSPAPPEPPLIDVPVVASTLKPGRTITASDFYSKKFTQKQLREVAQGEIFTNGSQLIGRVVREELPRGHVFSLDAVYPEGVGPNVSDLLQPGFRAVSVMVELVGGVRGFAQPETWVDVMFRRHEKSAGPVVAEIPRTQTLFRSVPVLAVKDNLYPRSTLTKDAHRHDDQYEITLALTPEQAEVLKSLEGRGTISLTLLPSTDVTEPCRDLPDESTMKTLLGIQDPPPAAAPAPIAPRVEIYQGGTAKEVVVNSDLKASQPPRSSQIQTLDLNASPYPFRYYIPPTRQSFRGSLPAPPR